MTETRPTEVNEQLKQAEEQKVPKRQTPFSKAFVEFIPTDWAPYPDELPAPLSSVPCYRTPRRPGRPLRR